MELLKYTLEQVSYAIVEPSYAFILVMMGLMFYFKNKKTSVMEKMIMGKNTISAFELTISQVVMGILGGVLASIMLTFLGITFYEASNIYLIFVISVALMLFSPKLVCFSYSGAILGLFSSILYFLSLLLDKPELNALRIDVTNLLILVGVMHIVEGILVMIDGKRGAIPVFGTRDKKIIGGFAYRRQWMLPMILLLLVQSTDIASTSGGVAIPQWWPIINHKANAELLSTMIIAALPIFAGMNYSTITFTKEKSKKPLFSGVLILSYGLLIVILSLLGNINPILDVAILVIMPLCHEYMLYFDRKSETCGKVKYISSEEGLCVLDVAPHSIAHKMGIKTGDLIVEINSMKVERDEVVFNTIENLPRNITMKVRKANGAIKELLGNNNLEGDKLGLVVVPREMPKRMSVTKGNNSNFDDIFKKIKDKKDNRNNK